MVCDFHVKFFFDGLLNLQKPWVTIFQHLPAVQVNEMIVLAELVRTLILCAVVPELMLDD